MTHAEAKAALILLLAPINLELDALNALAVTVGPLVGTPEAATSPEVATYLAQIAVTWPAGLALEGDISALQENFTEYVDEVDAFWTRLHQAKQLGVGLGFQP
jgi:hypothetical protein